MYTLRAIYIIWYREVLHHWREKSRIFTSLVTPFMLLFVFGLAMATAASPLTTLLLAEETPLEIDYVKFIYPGIMVLNIFNTAFMGGISIAWDRQFGFLKEILVAPISRTAVAVGRILGGATVSAFQGLLILIYAPFIGVPVTIGLVLKLIPLTFFIAFALTAFAIFIAARVKNVESFQAITQLLLAPMIMFSAAMYPVRNLPGWLNFLVKINPVTYLVDSLRKVVFQALNLPVGSFQRLPELGLGVIVLGHPMTLIDELVLIGGLCALITVLAIWAFRLQSIQVQITPKI